ncbi:MAG: cation:proton antiporter [Nitrososphaeraceae archaeon]|nr:cation:proton antiporter [Nitrososphaeraceae archaeon]MDW0146656.1 cation:proton antiporter [Nitrososphaeraceae archaeon]MDW0152312.1 cation:proton antiporter [Nitrososphaeraceae archaeon]MDW0167236.1 cation:proton antiporter [Nitrososphaeraceae archaeon]
MAESGLLIVTFMLSFSVLLVVISAVHRYMRNIIIPGVAILMFLGAILPVVPNLTHDVEDFYGITERIPEIILYVIIPILIFESGRKLSIGQIKKEAIPIGFFAIIGVIITILIIGIAVTTIFQIPFTDGLLFGTILAATDPVAVGIIFKKFPIPHRLNLIIEGESLFNDATGVISFNVVKAIIFSGVAFSLLDTSISFIWTMVGAIAFGTGLGWIGGKILNKWKADEYVDFTFSLGLAIAGYIVADHYLHVSGVVTTLFTAILLVTVHKEISTGIRRLFHKYWDYIGFITNSILFFLIGIPLLSVESYQSASVPLILILVIPFAIMMLSRAVVVYGGSTFLRIFRVKIPLKWQNVLTLGGLRGGIAVALALSIPAAYEFKGLFISLVVPLIAINLVVNPILLNWYLKKSMSSNMDESRISDAPTR